MLKSPSSPLKPRTIAQNAFKSRAVSILLDSRTPTGRRRHRLFRETFQNSLWFCKHSQKGRNRTAKIFFFSLNYKSFPIQTGFEQLSSSIRWRVMAIEITDVFQPRLGFVGAEIFTNFWCFVHHFGYRYAIKSFKGSKDADFGLVSDKILRHNNGPIRWGPGPGKYNQKHPHLWRYPPKTPFRKRNIFFRFRLQDLLNPQRV